MVMFKMLMFQEVSSGELQCPLLLRNKNLFFFFLIFLEPYLRYMEVPRLRVKLELAVESTPQAQELGI